MSTIAISPRSANTGYYQPDIYAANLPDPNPAGATSAADPCQAPAHLRRAMDNIFHRSAVYRSEHRAIVEISHAVARAVFEIVAGYRTVNQLAFVMEPSCIAKLRRRALLETQCYTLEPLPGTAHGQIISLHLDRCISGSWECTVILGFKYRVRAVALKIEPWHGRWQVTDVELI
ncbi:MULTISPECIES: Rv3235 family protein [unclassified Glutamicibacter]|uniref:Rv3235 family protein n=1 Tax=unclassified Glutamicibacter TaxID=2627139 RepID=UPI000F9F92F0